MKESSAQANSGKSTGGVSFGKFFVLILIVLGVLYGPGLVKNGFQTKPKYFLLKKIVQFTGTETQGKPFFANDITVAGPNEVAITENLGGQVLVYDLKGHFVRKWGKGGAGPKEFNEPSGIAADRKGHVFVLDTWNSAIKTFDLEGKFLKSLDLTKYGFFYGPRRLGWSGDSFLVSNAANSRLARLSPTGELLSVWAGKEAMLGVSSAIPDGKGHFYVAADEAKKSRVQVFDESGKILQTIKTGIESSDLVLDSKGRLFVGCYGDPSMVFNAEGKYLGLMVDQDQIEKPLNLVMGMDIAGEDTLVTCGGDVVTIYKIVGEKNN